LGSIQSGFLDVFSPIQEGVTTLLTPVHDLISSIDDVVHASSQRDEYRRENRALIAQNAGLQAYRRDYLQLAALFKLDQEADVSSYDQVTAQVISESPSVWYSHVMIDVGSSAGVRLGNTVVDGDGLVGQVTTVAHNASEVTLITDSTSAVAARDAASGVWGIAEPAVGTSNELLLAFPSSQQVAPGDLIVTAGTTANGRSEYPPDIPIGHVTNVAAANGAISVEPNANVKQLELVQVLTAPRRHSSAPPGAGGLVPVS
jgi:rod shape-determining protein MreC